MMFSALLAGCTQLGPQSITRDRFDYSSAVADSWKQQALFNIVKLRYADSPVFVEVSQIVSGYTLQTTVSAGISHNVGPLGPFGPDSQNLGIQGQFTDRPTITYTHAPTRYAIAKTGRETLLIASVARLDDPPVVPECRLCPD